LSDVPDKKVTWLSRLGIRRDAVILNLQKLNSLESPATGRPWAENGRQRHSRERIRIESKKCLLVLPLITIVISLFSNIVRTIHKTE
jgi:hypothetical protein